MEMMVSTKGLNTAAEELSECSRKLKRISVELGKASRRDGFDGASLRMLSKQQDILEQRAKMLGTMAEVLTRTVDYTEAAEEMILDYDACRERGNVGTCKVASEQNASIEEQDAGNSGVYDLTELSVAIQEAVK